MTNREKYLESLTDEKLAKMIFRNIRCSTCPVGMENCRPLTFVNCENQLQYWLKQEVPSEGQGW